MRRLALALVLVCGCQRTETVTRVVNLHLASCQISAGSSGLYTATGDYSPAAQSSALVTDQPGQGIDGIPNHVQSLSLLAVANSATWQAVTLVPATGDLDMLLLPRASSCGLAVKIGLDATRVFGLVTPHALIATGTLVNQAAPDSFRIDLDTGKVTKMSVGLQKPRTHAPVAALGDGRAIVSGGVSSSVPLRNAEVYDDALADYDPNVIPLSDPRTDHAAVTLASGDVLLVGGRNDTGLLLPQCERISAATLRASESGQVNLTTPRTNAYALRLADGRILIGGGFDAGGTPVGSVEFLTPDGAPCGSQCTAGVTVPARHQHAFVPLDGGGALFVTIPELGDPPDFTRVWFVTPDGGATAIDNKIPLTDLALFAAAGGGAVLWNGSSWLAFDPWTGFSTVPVNASVDLLAPIATPDPGMRAWVEADGTVSVWRDSVRNAFSTEGPYLVDDVDFMTPDRFPAPAFDAQQGITLDAGEGVFVADARYLDFDADVDSPDGKLPLLVVRQTSGDTAIGEGACSVATASHVHVERRGASVSFSTGGPLLPCATIAPDARVSVGVRGSSSGSHARNLVVSRIDD